MERELDRRLTRLETTVKLTTKQGEQQHKENMGNFAELFKILRARPCETHKEKIKAMDKTLTNIVAGIKGIVLFIITTLIGAGIWHLIAKAMNGVN